MVRLKALQRLVKLLHGHVLAAAVRADFRHEKDLVALALERGAHPFLAAALVIFPGVVEKVHAGVDGFVRDLDGVVLGRRVAEAETADADDRHFFSGFAERLLGDFVGAVVAQLQRRQVGGQAGDDGPRSRQARLQKTTPMRSGVFVRVAHVVISS